MSHRFGELLYSGLGTRPGKTRTYTSIPYHFPGGGYLIMHKEDKQKTRLGGVACQFGGNLVFQGLKTE